MQIFTANYEIHIKEYFILQQISISMKMIKYGIGN